MITSVKPLRRLRNLNGSHNTYSRNNTMWMFPPWVGLIYIHNQICISHCTVSIILVYFYRLLPVAVASHELYDASSTRSVSNPRIALLLVSTEHAFFKAHSLGETQGVAQHNSHSLLTRNVAISIFKYLLFAGLRLLQAMSPTSRRFEGHWMRSQARHATPRMGTQHVAT